MRYIVITLDVLTTKVEKSTFRSEDAANKLYEQLVKKNTGHHYRVVLFRDSFTGKHIKSFNA